MIIDLLENFENSYNNHVVNGTESCLPNYALQWINGQNKKQSIYLNVGYAFIEQAFQNTSTIRSQDDAAHQRKLTATIVLQHGIIIVT